MPLADFESQRSRRSTYSELDERIETLTRSTTNSPIVFRPVHSQYETDDDDEDEDDDDKPFEHRTTTLNGDEDPLISLPAELRLSWKNIPEKNIEEERKEYVLYVQRNSRSIFAGILDPTMIKNDLLNNLVKQNENSSISNSFFFSSTCYLTPWLKSNEFFNQNV